MKKINSSVLFGLLIAILLSSCNTSLNIIKRKYRPGYSVNISSDKHQKQAIEKVETFAEPKLDSLVEKNNYDGLIASTSNTESVICDYKSPSFIIPCDTPPKNKMDDPNWSLYKEKKPNPQGNSKWKKIEPFNLAAFFILLAGVIISALIPTIGGWLFLLVLLTVIILSIISLVRIKKNPNKYSKFSKVFDWVFVSIGLLLATFILIALLVIGAAAGGLI
jgi:hypothetical protein